MDELASARLSLNLEVTEKLDSWRRDAAMRLLSRQDELTRAVEDVVDDKTTAVAVKELLRSGPSADAQASIAKQLAARGSQYADAVAQLLTGIASEKYSRSDKPAQQWALYYATLIRDQHSTNVYRRIALIRRQFIVLGVVLAAALVGVLALAWSAIDLNRPPTGYWTWASVFLFGILGGSLSAILSVGKRSQQSRHPESRHPEQLQQWVITATRPLVGGAAALVAYALFEAEVVRVGHTDNTASVLVVAFAAGFSERLISGAVDAITKT